MEPYFSRSTDRRAAWQGHETKANVRNVIRCARRDGRDLKVYASGADADGWATYTLIPAEQWDAYFAEDAAPVVFAPAKPTEHAFTPWPKTMRHFRDIVVTEKIDGTNAGIHIDSVGDDAAEWAQYPADSYTLVVDGTRYMLTAQSRNRLIFPGKTTDNNGFAAWVYENADQLVRLLGTGLHFGEWWGRGINRNYGLTERRFSLFDTHKHAALGAFVGKVWVEPAITLYQGPNDTAEIKRVLRSLAEHGSVTVNGWAKPEGICVYHSATRKTTKVTLDNNDAGKWEVA